MDQGIRDQQFSPNDPHGKRKMGEPSEPKEKSPASQASPKPIEVVETDNQVILEEPITGLELVVAEIERMEDLAGGNDVYDVQGQPEETQEEIVTN